MPTLTQAKRCVYVSRGGTKLEAALEHFGVDVRGLVCADLGSHVGGFVDCLLQRQAAKIYSVDTAYGILAWKLRTHDRVEVVERANAMHVTLQEPVDLVTVDVGWTPQAKILPNVARIIRPTGSVISLIKPHYESDAKRLQGGVLPEELVPTVCQAVLRDIGAMGWRVLGTVPSPIPGHGGNREVFALLRPAIS